MTRNAKVIGTTLAEGIGLAYLTRKVLDDAARPAEISQQLDDRKREKQCRDSEGSSESKAKHLTKSMLSICSKVNGLCVLSRRKRRVAERRTTGPAKYRSWHHSTPIYIFHRR